MGVFNYSEEFSGGELEKKRENRDDPSNRQTEEKNREGRKENWEYEEI